MMADGARMRLCLFEGVEMGGLRWIMRAHEVYGGGARCDDLGVIGRCDA